MLPFLISGLVTGAVYGLASVGLVVSYKTSGVFNFAYGALATVSAYLFYTLHVQHGLGWPVAAAICVFGLTPPLALALEYLGRAITRGGLATQVAATVGLALAIQAVVSLIYGHEQTRIVPVFLASGQTTIGSAIVQYSDLITFGVAATAATLLYIYFRAFRGGVAMRAIVDDPELLALSGTDPVRVRRVSWTIGMAFASASGVLFAALLPLDPVLITLLVVQAFGAAALGGFRSLPLTFAGGLAIGVLASLSTEWFTSGILAKLSSAVPFIVLFVALLVFPKRYLTENSRIIPRARADWRAPPRLQISGGLALLIFLALVPSFAGVHMADWTTAVGTAIIFLSLGLLVRLSGQVSLCQVAFAAIGACALGHLAHDQHLPWFVALLAAGLIAVPIGALLAIPAMRLSGLYLALATFGFGVTLSYMFYTQGFMFGLAGTVVPRPLGFVGDRSYYYLVLGFAVVSTLFVVALGRSRLGRLLRGMAESPIALATSGASVNVTRTLVFSLSAFMAAIGGALVAAGQQTVSSLSYPPFLSLTFLVLVVIALGREPWYAIMAAGLLILVPSYLTGSGTTDWLQLGFGVAAIAYAVQPTQTLLAPAALRNAADRVFGRAATRSHDRPEVPTVGGRSAPAPTSVRLDAVTMAFGGNVVLDGLSLQAPSNAITGLIGPNGAGKTTAFDVGSGLLRPRSGRVYLGGTDVTGSGPPTRARRGLGRTFQRMELFDSLTARDNVAMGVEASKAGRNPFSHLMAGSRAKREMAAATASAIALCELSDVADQPAGTLSTGQRRLVELARCLAGPFQILMLDEPSSGLDRIETERFGEILKRAVQDRGVGVLLVEHDMTLVLQVCDHVHVLDFGKPLYDGAPSDVLAAPIVRAIYLGEETDEIAAAEREVLGGAKLT